MTNIEQTLPLKEFLQVALGKRESAVIKDILNSPAWLDNLTAQYDYAKPYLENQWRAEIKKGDDHQLQERLWELYIIAKFAKAELVSKEPAKGYPDIVCESYDVECTCVSPGDTDFTPLYRPDTIIPYCALMQRVTARLSEKTEKIARKRPAYIALGTHDITPPHNNAPYYLSVRDVWLLLHGPAITCQPDNFNIKSLKLSGHTEACMSISPDGKLSGKNIPANYFTNCPNLLGVIMLGNSGVPENQSLTPKDELYLVARAELSQHLWPRIDGLTVLYTTNNEYHAQRYDDGWSEVVFNEIISKC